MSAHLLSPATQATLLLCSPLRAGRNKDVQTLSIGEFNELENPLSRVGARLEQLLEADAEDSAKAPAPLMETADWFAGSAIHETAPEYHSDQRKETVVKNRK